MMTGLESMEKPRGSGNDNMRIWIINVVEEVRVRLTEYASDNLKCSEFWWTALIFQCVRLQWLHTTVGARQWCTVSATLFNICIEMIVSDVL